MTEEEIKKQIEIQRNYFYTGATLPVKSRIEVLKKLKEYIVEHEKEIHDALHEDLGKSSFESYMCETGLVLSELTHMIQHIKNTLRNRMSTRRSPSLPPAVIRNQSPMVWFSS